LRILTQNLQSYAMTSCLIYYQACSYKKYPRWQEFCC